MSRDRQRHLENKLQRKFGIGLEEYEAMLTAQCGCCAICGQPERRTREGRAEFNLSVDHSHETGEIRGLLCSRCNTGIGWLGEAHPAPALDYLGR